MTCGRRALRSQAKPIDYDASEGDAVTSPPTFYQPTGSGPESMSQPTGSFRLEDQLYQRLLQIYESGKKAVVLIDEAQMLETRELMEEFRGLLNLEVPERKLISFVFFGLPEIEQNLKLDPPLAQRVALRYRLEPFTPESTEAYIKHRLRLAGCPRMPFTPEALLAVNQQGSPAMEADRAYLARLRSAGMRLDGLTFPHSYEVGEVVHREERELLQLLSRGLKWQEDSLLALDAEAFCRTAFYPLVLKLSTGFRTAAHTASSGFASPQATLARTMPR